MNLSNLNVTRLTDSFGYDCQPRFTPDGNWILFCSYKPERETEKAQYRNALKQGLVSTDRFEINIMRKDGSERKQLTDLNAISLSPYKHPFNDLIIFSSDYNSDESEILTLENSVFNLFITDMDGSDVQQVTYNPSFDGYPSFTSNGKKLVWTSQRQTRSNNSKLMGIYSADWISFGSPQIPSKK